MEVPHQKAYGAARGLIRSPVQFDVGRAAVPPSAHAVVARLFLIGACFLPPDPLLADHAPP
ncbi:MAG: hypothetical protein JWO24_1047 [Rhodospirillales bacterium]|nr:hypothetical protein [Rhodospirillales bacterium]